MKKLAITMLLLCVCSALHAQNHYLLQGQTRDSLLAEIPFANVMLLDTATQEMKSFAVTDINGKFQVRLEHGKTYELQVTYIGYIPFKTHIRMDEPAVHPYTIVLRESISNLDEVTVVAEMPVLITGDTISYKAEAFMDGDERKLEDVLEDLPGFEIKENGEIEIQGKRVEKVMVDGRDFFDGDSKLATKNIPADVIDRVQLLQNYNDISPMQGLRNDDRLALNIELKEDKKRIVFGDLESGMGPEGRYFGHANSFYYAPKTSINIIGDDNNIGEQSLTLNDYFRMTGGLNSLSSTNGTNFQFNAGEADIPLIDRNSANKITSKLAALNTSTNVTNQLLVSGFAIGFFNESRTGSNSLRTYPQQDRFNTESLMTATSIDNVSGLARFSAKYTPSYNTQVDYSFFGKRGSISQKQDRSSFSMESNGMLEESINRAPSNHQHQLRFFNAINEKNIIALEANQTKNVNETDWFLYSNNALFSDYLEFEGDRLSQALHLNSHREDFEFNYYYLLSKTTHLNISSGINHSKQELTSILSSEIADIQNQHNRLSIRNNFGQFSIRKKWNKLTIDPAVSLNSYNIKGQPVLENSQLQYLLPRIRLSYDFGSTHSIRFDYQQSIEFSDITDYTEAYFVDGYNTLRFGNDNMKPSHIQSHNLGYRNYNTFNFFNIYGMISYRKLKLAFTQNQVLEGIENLLYSTNSTDANKEWSAYTNLEKRFNNWRVSGSISRTLLYLNNQLEGLAIKNKSDRQRYEVGLSAKLLKIWSLRAGYTYTLSIYTSDRTQSKFQNRQPSISSTLSWKGLRLEASYDHTLYKNITQHSSSSFGLFDAAISFRKAKSPFELNIQGLNLLNTSEIRRDTFDNNLISTFGYYIQKRYVLFTLKYDL